MFCILRDLKKKGTGQSKQSAALTKETMNQITSSMTKGQDGLDLHSVTPEQMTGMLFSNLSLVDVPEQIAPQMNTVMQSLQANILQYLSLLAIAKELPHDE